MTDRNTRLKAFLAASDWSDALRSPLAGDASNRRYERLKHDTRPPAVLMDAPPEKGEDVRPFVKIARHLCAIGLSAPDIYAEDTENGFLLIEDLGDDLFARFVQEHPQMEQELYQEAAAALIVSQSAPAGDLAEYGVDAMSETAMLLTDWYLQHGSEQGTATQDRAEFHDLISEALTANEIYGTVLVQRDYHAENLLWLPDRTGPARVGLLDFQDAMLGHPAYDLASLLRDARRDVSSSVQSKTLEYFISQTGVDGEQFKAAYAVCSAQRNIRILGVFARLCVRDGKSNYPDLMPRVWRNLQGDLAHPALGKIKAWIDTNVPAPSEAVIARIKAAAHE